MKIWWPAFLKQFLKKCQKKSPDKSKKTYQGVRKNLAATYSPTLLSAVPSAMKGLTSEFGMGSGISSSPMPPEKMCQIIESNIHVQKTTLEISLN